MAVLICSLIATLVNLKKGPKAEQGMKKQLKAYWIRIKKYTDYLIFSAVALLVLRYAGPQILSLPDLAIENVEVLPKNLPTNINGNCLLTRPELRIVIKNKGDGPAGKFHLTIESRMDCEPSERECLYSIPPGETKEFTFTLGTSGDPSLVAKIWPDIGVKDKEPRNNSSDPIRILPVCTPTPTPTPTPMAIPEPPIMGFTVLIPRADDPRNLQPVSVEPGKLMPIPVNRNVLLHITAILNPGFGEAAKALTFGWKASTGEIDEEEKGPTVSYLTPNKPGLVYVVVEVRMKKKLIITRTFAMEVK